MARKKQVKAGTSKKSAQEKKELFVYAYIANGGNATQAAMAAGYSKGGAAKMGWTLTQDPQVITRLREEQEKLAEKHSLTADHVIEELSKIAHSDLRKLFNDDGSLKDIKDWPDDIAGAVASIEVEEIMVGAGEDRQSVGQVKKLKLWNKGEALTLSMKHLGLLIDRSEVTHNVSIADRIHEARKRSRE